MIFTLKLLIYNTSTLKFVTPSCIYSDITVPKFDKVKGFIMLKSIFLIHIVGKNENLELLTETVLQRKDDS